MGAADQNSSHGHNGRESPAGNAKPGKDDEYTACGAEIVRQAEEKGRGQRSGKTATQLLILLQRYFQPAAGQDVNYSLERYIMGEDGGTFGNQRRDVMSLSRIAYVEDAAFEGLMMTYVPSRHSRYYTIHVPQLGKINRTLSAVMGTIRPASANEPLLETPFEFKDTTLTIVCPFNYKNNHWPVFRARQNQLLVEVFDSATGDPSYRSEIDAALLQVMERFWPATGIGHHVVGRNWRCEWPATYQQRDGNSCGVHAIRNAVDLVFGSKVQSSHDADFLRTQMIIRLTEILEMQSLSALWGEDDPRVGDSEVPPALASGVAATPGAQVYPEYLESSKTIMYTFPETIKRPELERAFYAVSNDVGRQLPGKWQQHLHLAVLRHGDTGYGAATTQYNMVPKPTPVASLFLYGPDMVTDMTNSMRTRDDIELAPNVVIPICRKSSLSSGGKCRRLQPFPETCDFIVRHWRTYILPRVSQLTRRAHTPGGRYGSHC